MAEKSGKKKRMALVIVLCVVLTVAAVALGTIWSLHRAYPYDWKADITANSALYGQDPLFIASVIRTESGWRTGAKSSVGAMGLMQIMPDTGKWIASKNKWEYSQDKLTDGAYNIKLGCWYIDYLTRKFNGDKVLVLASYNAGENKVHEWVTEGRFANGQSDIPYPETRSFVRKVMDAYEKYKFLYQNR